VANASIVAAWKDSTSAYATAAVDEGGAAGRVEYGPVSAPLAGPDGAPRTVADLKESLRVALKAARDRQLATAQAVPISGAVNI
jgi:hypothetical protein